MGSGASQDRSLVQVESPACPFSSPGSYLATESISVPRGLGTGGIYTLRDSVILGFAFVCDHKPKLQHSWLSFSFSLLFFLCSFNLHCSP